MLISTGKDLKLCIHSYNKGAYEFVKQIDLATRFIASGIDFMDGKILVGHDCGVIASVDLKTQKQEVHHNTHHDGEVWGLEIN